MYTFIILGFFYVQLLKSTCDSIWREKLMSGLDEYFKAQEKKNEKKNSHL